MVALDAQGWSVFPTHEEALIVYLADDGNDSNDGLSEGAPKLTPAGAYAVLRHGYADRLRVKRGDTFTSGFGQWKKSGLSADYPMVVETYGSGARPIFQTGTATFVSTSGGGGSPSTIDFLAITDLEATAEGYTGNGGGDIHGCTFSIPSTAITIEGCRFTNFTTGITFTGGSPTGHVDFRVRRNDCSLNYGTTGSIGHGIYLANAQGEWLCEENVTDSNSASNESEMRHGVYMPEGSNGTDGTLRKNISSRNSSHGFNLRCGGTVENNLSLQNGVGFYMAGVNGGGAATYAPLLRYNVALDGKDIAGSARGHALTMDRWLGGECTFNVFANQTTGTGPAGITLQAGVFSDVLYEDNVLYAWENTSAIQATAAQLAGTTFKRNKFSLLTSTNDVATWNSLADAQAMDHEGNVYHRVNGDSTPIWAGGSRTVTDWGTLVGDSTISSAAPSYPDPSRTIVTYVQDVLEIGGGDIDDFIAGARANQKGAWDEAYTADAVNSYVRAGFGVDDPPSEESGPEAFLGGASASPAVLFLHWS